MTQCVFIYKFSLLCIYEWALNRDKKPIKLVEIENHHLGQRKFTNNTLIVTIECVNDRIGAHLGARFHWARLELTR